MRCTPTVLSLALTAGKTKKLHASQLQNNEQMEVSAL